MFMHNGRYPDLVKVVKGYQETNVPLVMHNGSHLMPYQTNGSDDIGIYLFIPKITKFFNLSLDQALNLFFYGIIFTSLLLSILGFFLLYKSKKARFISLIGMMLSLFLPLKINDIYIIGSSLSIAIIPFFLYLIKKPYSNFFFGLFLFFSGISIGFANSLRIFSGIGVLIFIIVLILLQMDNSLKQKFFFILPLFSGIYLSNCYIDSLIEQYKNYDTLHFSTEKNLFIQHPFWHTIYCGFGFINCLNRPGIKWDDGYSYEKAKSIDPSVNINDSSTIDNIIKNEVFNLLFTDSFFIFACLFAKIGVIIFLLLKYANIFFIGSFLSLFSLQKWKFKCAFLALIFFNALYPLLAIPFPEYTIGLITATILYGIININDSFIT